MTRAAMRRTVWLVAAGAMLAGAGLAGAEEGARIEQVSGKSFEDTVKHLQWGFGGYGLTVVAQFDYAPVLDAAGALVRKSRMFEVTRRAWARVVFQSNPAAALDLPLRVHVYEREDGKTLVSYQRPSALLGTHGADALTRLGEELDTALRDLVRVAIR